MANREKIVFEDARGYQYDFYKYDFGEVPDSASCIYIYAHQTLLGYFPVYIGMTTRSVSDRHKEHEAAKETFEYGFHGATCLLVHTRDDVIPWSEDQLRDIESALISKYQPVCNRRS